MPIFISNSDSQNSSKGNQNPPQKYAGWYDMLDRSPKDLDWSTFRVVKNGIVVYTPQMTPEERMAALHEAHKNDPPYVRPAESVSKNSVIESHVKYLEGVHLFFNEVAGLALDPKTNTPEIRLFQAMFFKKAGIKNWDEMKRGLEGTYAREYDLYMREGKTIYLGGDFDGNDRPKKYFQPFTNWLSKKTNLNLVAAPVSSTASSEPSSNTETPPTS